MNESQDSSGCDSYLIHDYLDSSDDSHSFADGGSFTSDSSSLSNHSQSSCDEFIQEFLHSYTESDESIISSENSDLEMLSDSGKYVDIAFIDKFE